MSTRSTAQPSASGSSAGVRPGKKAQTLSAVCRWCKYSIFGSRPGGSEAMPALSDDERSMIRRAILRYPPRPSERNLGYSAQTRLSRRLDGHSRQVGEMSRHDAGVAVAGAKLG